MSAAFGQFWATAWAELVMQWRRLGFWLAFGGAAALLLVITVPSGHFLLNLPPDSIYVTRNYTPTDLENLMTLNTATYAAMFFGLMIALLVADRIDRDRRLGMTELQGATTLGWGRYSLGKFAGNLVAVVLPTLLVYLLCGLSTLALGWPLALTGKFLLAFAVVFLPGTLAVVGVTLLLASFLPLRVVQVGFSLLWIELNIGLGWRELGYTILQPSGLYVFPVVFPVPTMQYTLPGFQTTAGLAVLNIVCLLLTGVIGVALTYVSLRWQQQRAERA